LIKLFKNKKFIIALLVVFLVTGGVFVLGAYQTHAAGLGLIDFISGKAIGGVFAWLMDIVLSFFSKFLGLAAGLLEAVFKMTGITKDANGAPIPLVQNGWAITRGLANMFFALILLIMAVSTVLGLESFGARKLLVRLIISALLINFSLLFAGIIIDFAQVLTNYFITAAGGTAGISANFANGLNIASVFADPTNFNKTMAVGDATALINLGIGMLFGIIVIAIATFVMLAASIFLIVRIAALWLLLIFAPLAWVSMIVPGGMVGSLWGRWWKSFFQYTFFAPIYAFFLFLAAMAVGSGSFQKAFANASVVPNDSGILSGFFGQTMPFILQYIVVIIILCGGLFVAKEFGVVGASTVINAGKKAGKATAKYTARKGTGYDKWAPRAMSAAGSAAGAIGLKKTGEMMKGKSVEMKEKQLTRRENQLRAKHLSTLSDKELDNKIEKGSSLDAMMAARVKQARNTLNKSFDKVKANAMQAFRDFGAEKELLQLEELSPNLVKDKARRDAAALRAATTGAAKQWSKEVFDSIHGDEINEIVQQQVDQGKISQDDYNSVYRSWSDDTKKAADARTTNSFTDDFNRATPGGAQNLKRRERFAAATGKVRSAFEIKTGALAGSTHVASIREYAQKLTPTQIGNIKDNAEIEAIGEGITVGQLNIRGELNGTQKYHLKQGALRSPDPKVVSEVTTNPGWASI